MVRINEFAVEEVSSIVLNEKEDGWKKLSQLRQLLNSRYDFYITTDGCGNIFVHFDDRDHDKLGSARYKWVSAEEDEFLDTNRAEEQEHKNDSEPENEDEGEAKLTAYYPSDR